MSQEREKGVVKFEICMVHTSSRNQTNTTYLRLARQRRNRHTIQATQNHSNTNYKMILFIQSNRKNS
jgi:hypothetical protein